MKIRNLVVLALPLAIIGWFVYPMQKAASTGTTNDLITIKTSDNQEISVPRDIAQKIQPIAIQLNYDAFIKNPTETIHLNQPASVLNPIFNTLNTIEQMPYAKQADGTFIAQKIQPIMDQEFGSLSRELLSQIIQAADMYTIYPILNGAIRVLVKRILIENSNKPLAEMQIEYGTISSNPLFAKHYHLIDKKNIPSLYRPKEDISELSIADYIAINGQPAKVESSILLSHKGITSFEGINKIEGRNTLDMIDLSFNYIQNLPSNIFKQFPNLKELYLHNNQISFIPAQAFNGLNLQALRLSGNKIKNIAPNALKSLGNLQRLIIGDNPINRTITKQKFIQTYLPNLSANAEIAW